MKPTGWLFGLALLRRRGAGGGAAGGARAGDPGGAGRRALRRLYGLRRCALAGGPAAGRGGQPPPPQPVHRACRRAGTSTPRWSASRRRASCSASSAPARPICSPTANGGAGLGPARAGSGALRLTRRSPPRLTFTTPFIKGRRLGGLAFRHVSRPGLALGFQPRATHRGDAWQRTRTARSRSFHQTRGSNRSISGSTDCSRRKRRRTARTAADATSGWPAGR